MQNYYWEVVSGDLVVKVRLSDRPVLTIEEKWDELLCAYMPGKQHWQPLQLICNVGDGEKIIKSSPQTLTLVLRSKQNDSVIEKWFLGGTVTTENPLDFDIIEVTFNECRYEQTGNQF